MFHLSSSAARPARRLRRGLSVPAASDAPHEMGRKGPPPELAQREKHRITLVAIAAGLALTCLKLVVGLLTGSLGILSEAVHSGIDLVGSIITYISVRIAGRPADQDHPYGHGRFENLSAMIQGLLLIITAGVIIYESVRRIFFVTVEVEVSTSAFLVMGTGIAIDVWRSRLLSRAARRYHSQAMEAGALNFRADVFSSGVVILGLGLVAYGKVIGGGGVLARADALAALVVAIVIVAMSVQLVLKGVNVLLDRAPVTLQKRMTIAAASVPGVVKSQPVRLRESGDRLFADITVAVPRTTSLAAAHTITEQVEGSIRQVEPRTETVVHVEPTITETETAAEQIRAIALWMGVDTHHERVYWVEDHLEASVHIQVEPSLTLQQGHHLAHRLVAALKDDLHLRRVNTHIEVGTPHPDWRRDISQQHPEYVENIRQIVTQIGVAGRCDEVRLYRSEGSGTDVVLHCKFPLSALMGEIHRRTELLEQALRERLPELEHVLIHAEPDRQTAA